MDYITKQAHDPDTGNHLRRTQALTPSSSTPS